GVGQSYTQMLTVTIPGKTLPGTYRYWLITDYNNQIGEPGDEANNEVLSSATVTLTQPARPNLQVDSVVVPADGLIGDTLSVDYTVQNTGTVSLTGVW